MSLVTILLAWVAEERGAESSKMSANYLYYFITIYIDIQGRVVETSFTLYEYNES